MPMFARAAPSLRAGLTSCHQLRAGCRSYADASGQSSGGAKILGLPIWLLAAVGVAGAVELSGNGVFLKAKSKEAVEAVKQAAAPAAPREAVLIKDQWIPFTLSKVEPYNHNSKVYHFEFPPEGKDKTTGIPVAGALLTKAPDEAGINDDKGKPVIRPYTPISSPDETGSVKLLIKEYKGGKLTPFISTLKPGEGQLMFKGPIEKYKYQPNTFDRGLCIAGGSGITPMYQLINHSLSIPDDKTKWTLIFSNVTEADILLRKEWENLAKQHKDRLDIKFVLDKAPRGWQGPTGFINAQMISQLFPYHDGQNKVMAFVCGPPPQVKSISGPKDGPRQGEVQGALKDLGYTSDEVFKF
ncbi:hypothetical protein BD324DRAFT_612102 [Kockovaella imperatae]|uniref:NADH-cytochrome b5 reductase n=1 Tax=Kockovaella imperatae TaxID=4999 RepID=A0A1Y1UTD3_9TREE|nr:hypothetical protein BD324DRAFT_612102 [Kockovaella imperatae]ORX40784.1 hypothetical protein BD324DRAFT_612102 [Kockovaella imperatae]